jgi:hypothetical protein
MQIGLGGCSLDEFQLEMRQVKFLLDYHGAREFEYRLTREWHSATKMKTREGLSFISPVCIAPHECTVIVDANLCISVSYT